MTIMNMEVTFGNYGEVIGAMIYKYFDMQTLLSGVVVQVLITLFAENYFWLMIFLACANAVAYLLAERINFKCVEN